MKKILKKFVSNERGDVVQYILVLAVVAVILAFSFPKVKEAIAKNTTKTMTNINGATTDDMDALSKTP